MKLYIKTNSLTALKKTLYDINKIITDLETYYSHNYLIFNSSKIENMIFYNKCQTPHNNTYINNRKYRRATIDNC